MMHGDIIHTDSAVCVQKMNLHGVEFEAVSIKPSLLKREG